MGDLLNLRQARKRAARRDRDDRAAAARAASSVPGRVCKAAKLDATRADAMLDAHRLDTAVVPSPDDRGV